MTPEAKIGAALDIAIEWGSTDGAHHKAWVIDQMVRALTGCPVIQKTGQDVRGADYTFEGMGESEEYKALVTAAKDSEDGHLRMGHGHSPVEGGFEVSHLGEPCIHCGATLETMQPGPCEKSTGLAATMREVIHLDALLAKHKEDAERKTKQLEGAVAARRTVLNQVEAGLDPEKIALAETVIYASDYSLGGQDRGSARGDAIKWLATGKPVDDNVYKDLRRSYFGTKNYDRWSGQREDHEYGMGPRHGSTVFEIGLRKEARNRDLTDAEREAAIYYLINLERVQAARAASAA